MQIKKHDYYKILKLPKNSSIEEIKKRYKELAKIYHPDLNPSKDAEEKFKEINEAYNKILSIKENSKRKKKNLKKDVVIKIKVEIKNSIRTEIKRAIKKNFIKIFPKIKMIMRREIKALLKCYQK